MTEWEQLNARSEGKCELCESSANLSTYAVPPFSGGVDHSIVVCTECLHQLTGEKPMDPNYWRSLNNTMWSTEPPVQVVVWRVLNKLKGEGWPQDLLDMLFLEDGVLQWAKEGAELQEESENNVVHKDSNGTVLQSGDSVVLIKDLDVKGGGLTAKRGTTVKGIALVEDNPEQIEGKVSGQQIVILTKFVKKA